MIPLGVVVRIELPENPPDHLLVEEDHPAETLYLDRPDHMLRERVEIRAPGRQLHELNPFPFHQGAHTRTGTSRPVGPLRPHCWPIPLTM